MDPQDDPLATGSSESPRSKVEFQTSQISLPASELMNQVLGMAQVEAGQESSNNLLRSLVLPPAKDRRFSMDTEDIVAVGAVVLCIGGVFAAITVALGLAFGKVQGADATKIIIGCVGGSSIAAILAKLSASKQKKNTK